MYKFILRLTPTPDSGQNVTFRPFQYTSLLPLLHNFLSTSNHIQIKFKTCSVLPCSESASDLHHTECGNITDNNNSPHTFFNIVTFESIV